MKIIDPFINLFIYESSKCYDSKKYITTLMLSIGSIEICSINPAQHPANFLILNKLTDHMNFERHIFISNFPVKIVFH